MPVGLLATLLNKRVEQLPAHQKLSLSFKPLRPDELPTSLPAREPPTPQILAAVERYYKGEKPLRYTARPRAAGRETSRGGGGERRRQSRSRSRSPPPRGLGGGGGGGYDRPTASAHAEIGVREDGSAIGERGKRHVGLGGAGPASTGAGDAFDDFRRRGDPSCERLLLLLSRRASPPLRTINRREESE